MKKKILAVTGALALVGTLGVGMYQSNATEAAPELDQGEIVNLISAEYPGTITEFELEKEGNRAIYEIEIENEDMEYELKVDANSGEILKSEEERNTSDKAVKENNPKVKTGKNNSNLDLIDINEAIEIALAEFSGEVEEAELDNDDGRFIYEIEIEAGEQEAEFDIDAVTGEILDMEIDD